MGALGLNELKNKFALTPSSQTSSSQFSLEVQLPPSILCTEGGPLAKFLGIVCPLMRGLPSQHFTSSHIKIAY